MSEGETRVSLYFELPACCRCVSHDAGTAVSLREQAATLTSPHQRRRIQSPLGKSTPSRSLFKSVKRARLAVVHQTCPSCSYHIRRELLADKTTESV